MKRYISVVAVFLLVMTAIPASASVYLCQGTVTSIGLYSNGMVGFTGAGGVNNIAVCSIYTNSGNGWTPESCKATYATLLGAKLSGQQVQLEFNDGLTCS